MTSSRRTQARWSVVSYAPGRRLVALGPAQVRIGPAPFEQRVRAPFGTAHLSRISGPPRGRAGGRGGENAVRKKGWRLGISCLPGLPSSPRSGLFDQQPVAETGVADREEQNDSSGTAACGRDDHADPQSIRCSRPSAAVHSGSLRCGRASSGPVSSLGFRFSARPVPGASILERTFSGLHRPLVRAGRGRETIENPRNATGGINDGLRSKRCAAEQMTGAFALARKGPKVADGVSVAPDTRRVSASGGAVKAGFWSGGNADGQARWRGREARAACSGRVVGQLHEQHRRSSSQAFDGR